MPMLAVDEDLLAAHVERLAERAGDRSASRLGVAGSTDGLGEDDELVAAEAGHGVPGRGRRRQPGGRRDEQLVAGACPRLSLTTLKRSRSRKSTASRPRVALAPGRASRRSSSRLRLGRPVSGSCMAWWVSRS